MDIMVLPTSLHVLYPALKEDGTFETLWQVHDNTWWWTPPDDLESIHTYWKEDCEQRCWDDDWYPRLKIRYQQSCLYGYDTPYTLDIFTQPPREVPSSLKPCRIEDIPCMCPGDTEAWLLKEFGEGWEIPVEYSGMVDRVKKSDPFHPCQS